MASGQTTTVHPASGQIDNYSTGVCIDLKTKSCTHKFNYVVYKLNGEA